MYKFIFSALIASSCLFCSSLKSEPEITAYFVDNFPPYYYLDKSGKPAGLVIEIAEKILSNSQISYKLEPMNVTRLMKTIKKGGNVVAIGAYKTKEREAWALFSGEIYHFPQPIFAVKSTSFHKFPLEPTFENVAKVVKKGEIKGYLLADYSYGDWVDNEIARHFKGVERDVLSIHQILKFIASPRRPDFTLAYPAQVKYFIEQEYELETSLRFLEVANAPLSENIDYWMFAKDCDPKLISLIRYSTEEVRKSDFYKNKIKQYTLLNMH